MPQALSGGARTRRIERKKTSGHWGWRASGLIRAKSPSVFSLLYFCLALPVLSRLVYHLNAWNRLAQTVQSINLRVGVTDNFLVARFLVE